MQITLGNLQLLVGMEYPSAATEAAVDPKQSTGSQPFNQIGDFEYLLIRLSALERTSPLAAAQPNKQGKELAKDGSSESVVSAEMSKMPAKGNQPSDAPHSAPAHGPSQPAQPVLMDRGSGSVHMRNDFYIPPTLEGAEPQHLAPVSTLSHDREVQTDTASRPLPEEYDDFTFIDDQSPTVAPIAKKERVDLDLPHDGNKVFGTDSQDQPAMTRPLTHPSTAQFPEEVQGAKTKGPDVGPPVARHAESSDLLSAAQNLPAHAMHDLVQERGGKEYRQALRQGESAPGAKLSEEAAAQLKPAMAEIHKARVNDREVVRMESTIERTISSDKALPQQDGVPLPKDDGTIDTRISAAAGAPATLWEKDRPSAYQLRQSEASAVHTGPTTVADSIGIKVIESGVENRTFSERIQPKTRSVLPTENSLDLALAKSESLPQTYTLPSHNQSLGAVTPMGQTLSAQPHFGGVWLQIAQSLTEASHGKTVSRTELTLSPDDLGRVRLEVSTLDDTTTIRVFAERPDTLDFLRRSSESLAAELRQMGLNPGSLSFGTWNESKSGKSLHHNTAEISDAVHTEKNETATSIKSAADLGTGRLHIRL